MAGVAAEAALKAKWKLIKRSDPPPSMTFAEMIDWASKEGLLAKDDQQVAHLARVLPNVYKHEGKAVADTDPVALLAAVIRLTDSLF